MSEGLVGGSGKVSGKNGIGQEPARRSGRSAFQAE